MTNGPDDASRVVWAISECFFFIISCSFLILTTVIYSFSNGPMRRDPNDGVTVVWAPVLLLVPTSTSLSLPDASLYNPPPTPRPPPPPPQKHPRGPNDEIQANDDDNGPKKTSNNDINSCFWGFGKFFFIYCLFFWPTNGVYRFYN